MTVAENISNRPVSWRCRGERRLALGARRKKARKRQSGEERSSAAASSKKAKRGGACASNGRGEVQSVEVAVYLYLFWRGNH